MAKGKNAAPKEAKIVGYLEEVELENGDIGLRIEDDDDHSYLIDMDKQGRTLLDYVDEEVEITGIVTKDRGVHNIKISKFRVLDDIDDEDNESRDYDGDDFMRDPYDD